MHQTCNDSGDYDMTSKIMTNNTTCVVPYANVQEYRNE